MGSWVLPVAEDEQSFSYNHSHRNSQHWMLHATPDEPSPSPSCPRGRPQHWMVDADPDEPSSYYRPQGRSHSTSKLVVQKSRAAKSSSVPKGRGKSKSCSAKGCCLGLFKFLFSHIGLCGMVIGYTIAGGFIFQVLEMSNELRECVEGLEAFAPILNATSQHFLDMIQGGPRIGQFREIMRHLLEFRDEVLDLGYDGKNCTLMEEKGTYRWSFPGSLLFSVTVVTTIGG